jgi:hypothetical protein
LRFPGSRHARIQVEGERMRRYEKEMFIYAAAPANRAKYVKEHDESHRRLLALLTQAAAPSGTQFSDEDRGKLLAWKEATTFYGREFARIVVTADGINVDTLPTDQKLALTTRLNGEIKEGKDRFATVLKGADEMRAAKEAQSLVIEREIASVFLQLKYMMLVVSLLVVGAAAWRVLRRPGARVSPPANPRPLGLRRY